MPIQTIMEVVNMPRILELILSCGGCPHYQYATSGRYDCRLVNQGVNDKTIVAPFCPLPIYPADVIASMETTIDRLFEPYKFTLPLSVIEHVARKIKVAIVPNGRGLVLKLADETEVYLDFEYIIKLEIKQGAEIHFKAGDDTYRLFPDAVPPHLDKMYKCEGDEAEERWIHTKLAT